jgi:hypothetical protein
MILQVAHLVTKNEAHVAKERLEKLLAKREEMNAKIRREMGRDRSLKRRQDTRRKIIAAIRAWLSSTAAKLLTRADERELFGLAPLQEPANSSPDQQHDSPPPSSEQPSTQR